MRFLICALILFSSFIQAEDSIVVELATENPLAPLFIVPFNQQQSAWSSDYVRQLENILRFDWNHNGSTTVVQGVKEISELPLQQFGTRESWQARRIGYVLKGELKGKELQIAAFNVTTGTVKISEPKTLSGLLAQDRRIIHQLSDSFHQALFGREGIASTHLLYTVKIPIKKEGQALLSEIWESDYDGANARPVTNDRSFVVTPAYIPPKKGFTTGGFVYVSYQLGQPKIYAGLLKNGEASRVMSLKGSQMMPAISRQRDRIAFISDITGNPDLFVQPFSPEKGAIGKPEQIFSARQATQSSPAFSPDGKQIAFVSDKDGSPKIYVIQIPNPGTSLKNIKATLITKRNRENSAPSWSPDGTKIAYCSRIGSERQICMVDLATGQEKQLTQGSGHKENPSWAPGSQHLVYNSANPSECELYILSINGGEPIKITSGPGEKKYPNWEPR
ncbi:MAG: Tol-Pal system protein TolB [Parachlamydia sp.]|jgi:TolB protein|nr:Tol-Pal system protein TolB [Parachlamydia sp.]